MAIKFRKVAREVIGGPDKGQIRYYAMAKAAYHCDFDKMCNLVATRSKMSASDVKCAIDAFIWTMNTELNSGAIVQMGEFGNFRCSVQSAPSLTEKGVTAHLIQRARIIFSPGVLLKRTVRDATFEPYDVIERVVVHDEPCLLPHE